MQSHHETQLQELFSEIFEVDRAAVPGLRRIATEKWDSLAQTALIAGIESEFDIALDISDMEQLTSYEATKLLLEEKGM